MNERNIGLYGRYHQLVAGVIADRVGGDQALADELAKAAWDAAVVVTDVDVAAIDRLNAFSARLGMGRVIVR